MAGRPSSSRPSAAIPAGRTPSPLRAADRTRSGGGAPRRRGYSPRPHRRRAPRVEAAARHKQPYAGTERQGEADAFLHGARSLALGLEGDRHHARVGGAAAVALRRHCHRTPAAGQQPPPDGAGERPPRLRCRGEPRRTGPRRSRRRAHQPLGPGALAEAWVRSQGAVSAPRPAARMPVPRSPRVGPTARRPP